MFVIFFQFEQSLELMFVSTEATGTLGDLYYFSVAPGEERQEISLMIDDSVADPMRSSTSK